MSSACFTTYSLLAPALLAPALLAPALLTLPAVAQEGPQPLVADAATTIVNLAVAVFLAYLVYLLVARKPKRPARKS